MHTEVRRTPFAPLEGWTLVQTLRIQEIAGHKVPARWYVLEDSDNRLFHDANGHLVTVSSRRDMAARVWATFERRAEREATRLRVHAKSVALRANYEARGQTEAEVVAELENIAELENTLSTQLAALTQTATDRELYLEYLRSGTVTIWEGNQGYTFGREEA